VPGTVLLRSPGGQVYLLSYTAIKQVLLGLLDVCRLDAQGPVGTWRLGSPTQQPPCVARPMQPAAARQHHHAPPAACSASCLPSRAAGGPVG
jgi:hypothetical protein